MSARFEQAEILKKQYTDKFVVVRSGAPELRRFQGLTGTVKTVNMSCRALVQFDGPADIGWYDIDPSFLTIVDAPEPKKAEGHGERAAKEAPVAKVAPAAAKPAASEKKLSPLDMIRQQGAAGSKPAATPAASAVTAAGGAKASPLDLIRQQGAAKAGGVASAAASGASPAAKLAPVAGGESKKLSPIEMIRMQGAAKAAGGSTPALEASAPAPTVTEPTPAPAPVAEPKPPPPTPADGKKLSPIEMIRMQAASKGNK